MRRDIASSHKRPTRPEGGRPAQLGLDEARSQFPSLVTAAAARGASTIITRRGEPVAAVVPLAALPVRGASAAQELLSLVGSGRGLWGASPGQVIDRLRAEWN
jgi:prevent-host-death family protein